MPKEIFKYALLFAAFSGLVLFMAVLAFTSEAIFPSMVLTNTGEIGDTIGGITAPFIGVTGAGLTFLAFYIQFKANEKHNLQFDAQYKNNARDKHENKLLYLIQQNRKIANGMTIGDLGNVVGPKCFNRIFSEFRTAYEICESKFRDELNNKDIFNMAYAVFYNGIGPMSNKINESLLGDIEEYSVAMNLFNVIKTNFSNKDILLKIKSEHNIEFDESLVCELEYVPFEGHNLRLGQYFRNLFHILSYTKDVIDEELMSRDEKREIIKTLRSQMSSYEQIIIYFNSLSYYGLPMKEKGYIKEYRLIKNIPLPLVDFVGDVHDNYPDLDFEWDDIMKRRIF